MALSTTIDKALKGLPETKSQRHHQGLYEAIVDDLANAQAQIVGLEAQLAIVTAQLDLDATVTDTDYAANAVAAKVAAVTPILSKT